MYAVARIKSFTSLSLPISRILTMADTIKYFQFIQILYRIVGIQPLKAQNSLFASYNWRNLTVLLLFLIMSTASVAFFLYKAHSFTEYSDSFYQSITFSFIGICFLSVIPKMNDIFILMENYERFVEKSK